VRAFLEVNGVWLNSETREVICDGVPVDVTYLESEILGVLMRSAGRVISRDELARSLPGELVNAVGRDLDVHVHHLKRKLERGRRLIVMVHDAGYLFSTADDHAPGNYRLA
jgi:two-component system response regulator CpxR